MGEKTKIEWCDHTFNPWRGCTKVAAGCANCYAEAQAKRNTATLGVWGPNGTRVVAAESAWKQVERWDRDAKMREESYQIAAMTCRSEYDFVEPCYPPDIFCGSMCDVFEDWRGPIVNSKGVRISHVEGACEVVMTLADVRQRLFRLIDATPNLTWLVLTKRPENIRSMCEPLADTVYADGSNGDDIDEPPAPMSEYPAPKRDNVWLGTSIACRADLDNAWHLSRCGDLCAGTFLSIEPLIEDLGDISHQLKYVDQVIIGGESGPHARPCDIEWVRSIARQCEAAGVKCMVKQIGSNPVGLRFSIDDNGRPFCIENDSFRGGAKPLDKKGGDPAEWPEDLRKYRRLAWKGGA